MQELLGTVADLSWESTGHLLLTAACDLPADTPLTPALVASRAEPAHLLHMHGPSALAWAQQQATARQQTANMQAQHRRDHQTVSMQVQPHSNPDIPHTQLHQLPSKQDQLGSSEDKSKGELPPCSAKQAAAQHQQPSLESVCAWQASEAASFELCMEPSPQDMARGAKLLLLQASTLGTSHFLTRRSSQVRSQPLCGEF